jgi:hypothetical protein
MDRNVEALSQSEQALVRTAFVSLPKVFESSAADIDKGSAVIRLPIRPPDAILEFRVETNQRVYLAVSLMRLMTHGKWTDSLTLLATLREPPRRRGERWEHLRVIRFFEYKPTFRFPKVYAPERALKAMRQVVWIGSSLKHEISSEVLAAYLLKELLDEIQTRSSRS